MEVDRKHVEEETLISRIESVQKEVLNKDLGVCDPDHGKEYTRVSWFKNRDTFMNVTLMNS